MSEIYWITRLDYLEGVAIAVIIIAGFYTVAALIAICNEQEDTLKRCRHIFKYSVPSLLLGIFLLCFVPNTKEAMLIYGVGGTIDYIKSNDKAKQLPDKCIDALTRYVDSIEKENKDNNNN